MTTSTSSVAGVVAGNNPLEYSSSSPYTLFLFQAVFIILLCQVLHYPLSKLQQPKVIAEVMTGVILGPTVMGRIPNFTDRCFPDSSIPGLTLLANVGIILFLFIIGLEVDLGFIKKHIRAAVSVGLINMAIPFALGCAISRGMYDQYVEGSDDDTQIKYTTFMVFIATAMCITAFPVLARILTELNLIGDRVGTIVLAAGITNDLTGWILLALVVTLANSSKGVNTVYILLLTVAWFLIITFPVKRIMRYLLKRFSNDLVTGEPSQLLMLCILMLVFVSAFYTDIIGVHPIFGAFMVGVIVPRDNGYVIKITEKLEDLVHIVLIPLYFALSGLNVNLGLLDSGLDWGYTIGIIILAVLGKVIGGVIASKFNKLLWRESLAVGVLMSCKGIVEIVVLTVGLNAGIISQRVYSMFIVMALVTTFLTTPLALLVYPIDYRIKVDKFLKNEINWDGTLVKQQESLKEGSLPDSALLRDYSTLEGLAIEQLSNFRLSKVVLLMKKIEPVSHLMSFLHDISLLSQADKNYDIDVKGLLLREFSSRTSHLLEASSQSVNDDPPKEATDFEKPNKSILVIMKMFNELLGNHYTSKSILSTFKNQLFTINDQISEKSDLLIASAKVPTGPYFANDEGYTGENSDFSLYKKLFNSCNCHFGLLLFNDRSRFEDEKTPLPKIDEYFTDVQALPNGEPESVFSVKVVNLILKHDNVLSASDLLALHIVFKLAFNLSCVNVFINSSSSKSVGFEKQIENLIAGNTKTKLSIHYIKESLNFIQEISRVKARQQKEIFVIANDLPKGNPETIFNKDVSQLIDFSLQEGFSVLAIKAAN